MENLIRVGKVSSVNHELGMIRVVYLDKGSSVTAELPVLSFNGEYKMPGIDDLVLVTHLSNGSAAGIVLGTFWSKANRPGRAGEDIYHKELGRKNGAAYFDFDEKTGHLTIRADSVEILTKSGSKTY